MPSTANSIRQRLLLVLRNKSQLTQALCFFLLAIVLSACDRSAEVGLHPGDLAPDFELEVLDTGGRTASLADYRGKITILNFFASWCVTCIEEMPSLQSLYQKYSGDCLNIVAVAVDDQPEKLRPFVKQFNLGFPILLDSTGKVRARYKVSGYPETFVLKSDGKVSMFFDYEKSEPATRILGPRDWTHESIDQQIQALCKKSSEEVS